MSKRVIAVLLVLAAAGGAYWVWARDRADGASYRFTTVERGDLTSVVSATGTLEAVTTVQVGTQVSGIIAEISADFNDEVEEGQVIARLDASLLDTAVEDAETTLRRRRAELEQAERNRDRIAALHREGVMAGSELDAAELAVDVARTDLEGAEVALARARRNRGYATITSPIDGTVIARAVDVGQTVAASLSAPELFRIAADLSQMQILAAVDESDIGRIHPGQPARFTVQAHPEDTFTGTVRQVRLQSTMQENVVSYSVVIDVDNQEGKLLPGMTATVDFVVATAEDVLMVANGALRFRPTEEMMAAVRQGRDREAGGRPGAVETGGAGGGTAARGPASEEAAGGAGGDGADGSAGGPRLGSRSGAGAGGEGFRRFAGGGLAGSGGAGRTLLWYLDAEGRPAATPVTAGISDGQMTEIAGPRVAEGLQVIVGVTEGSPQEATNPFQSQEQSSGRFRRGPGF